MNSMELVRFPTGAARPFDRAAKRSLPPFHSELMGPARNAIVRARQFLVAEQQIDGVWLGRQTADVSLPSQLIFLLAYLGREDSELAQQCAATILNEQRPDGGWSVAPEERADISTSVQAYFALKLTGCDPSDDRLGQAREKVRELGGADAANETTRFFLALLGELSYDYCDVMSPGMIPFGAPDQRRRVPLSIVWSHRPVRAVGIERGVRELFLNKPGNWPKAAATKRGAIFYRRFQPLVRFVCQLGERRGWTPFRRRALGRAESQLLEQIEPLRIWELDFHELVWHIVALHTIGYNADSPELRGCEERLYELVDVDEEAGFASPRLRATSWTDSALVLRSLVGSGLTPAHTAVGAAIDALCGTPANAAPCPTVDLCSFLESLNSSEANELETEAALPPDIDVCWDWQFSVDEPMQFARDRHAKMERAARWCIEQLRDHQNPDGGWGAMIGSRRWKRPSEPDATGAVLEALGGNARANVQSAVNRAADYLRSRQRADGSWASLAGEQQILCTSTAIRGLLAAGATPDDDAIAAGVNWLTIQQQPTGAWNTSASQTAWALLGLVAAGRANHPAARRGIEYLLESQDDDGGWLERHFVLQDPISNRWFRNDLHCVAWPLSALSRWAVAASSVQTAAADKLSLRLVGAGSEN